MRFFTNQVWRPLSTRNRRSRSSANIWSRLKATSSAKWQLSSLRESLEILSWPCLSSPRPRVVDNTATVSGATSHTPTRSDSFRQRKPSSHVGGRDALRARLAQQRTVLAGSPTLANSPPLDDIDTTDAPSHSARVEPANATLSSCIQLSSPSALMLTQVWVEPELCRVLFLSQVLHHRTPRTPRSAPSLFETLATSS